MNKNDHVTNLFEGLKQLTLAKKHLESSFKTCQQIHREKRHTEDELIQFEALTSRFARASDMLLQKVYRSIDAVELTEGGSLLDALHRAEKRLLLDSISDMRMIRDLRNDIAHEYITERLWLLHEQIVDLVPKLLDLIERAERYAEKFLSTT